MIETCLGAYATPEEASDALVLRKEPQVELMVRQDGTDGTHPYRIWWVRAA